MARRLPPLNALRAFEAAARHLSFTRAAGELHVTQAAISHQIKGLEERLGVALFRRLNRRLRLTEAGQTLFPPVGEALDAIADALGRLDAAETAGILTISTMDSLAAGWLVPRLGRFRRANPDIDVRITTSDQLADFAGDGVDMAIRYGRGDWPGLSVERLMTEEVFPVCSPALLERGPALGEPADLAHHVLLHDELREDWRMWLMAAGADIVDWRRGPGYFHSNLVVQAAIAGEGVALGRSVLVADGLAEGRLVRPFDVSLPVEFAYYVVCPEAFAERPKVKAFRQWLLGEAGGDGAPA
jgi:LysR family glycine cleavage system transcriptional activator